MEDSPGPTYIDGGRIPPDKGQNLDQVARNGNAKELDRNWKA